MGDIIEVPIIPNHEMRFYKISSNCLTFSVKSSGYATLGLAPVPNYASVSHWIFIDKNGYSGMSENKNTIIKVKSPDLNINPNRYKKFWLTWNNGKIELGKFDEEEPIFSKEVSVESNLQYITFIKYITSSTTYWKFAVPPPIEKPVLKPIPGGKPYWVPYDGLLPYGALIGGYENEFLYIMRAPHRGSLTPGKFVPSMSCGIVCWGGDLHIKSDFEILCAIDCIWVETQENSIPAGALLAGYTENMYVGRAAKDGHIIPGKVASSHSVCYFAYNNEEQIDTCYEILVVPHLNSRWNSTVKRSIIIGNDNDLDYRSDDDYRFDDDYNDNEHDEDDEED